MIDMLWPVTKHVARCIGLPSYVNSFTRWSGVVHCVRTLWLLAYFFLFNDDLSFQIEEIVGRFGMVVIDRNGCNPEKCIYESDILTRHKVRVLFLFSYYYFKDLSLFYIFKILFIMYF